MSKMPKLIGRHDHEYGTVFIFTGIPSLYVPGHPATTKRLLREHNHLLPSARTVIKFNPANPPQSSDEFLNRAVAILSDIPADWR